MSDVKIDWDKPIETVGQHAECVVLAEIQLENETNMVVMVLDNKGEPAYSWILTEEGRKINGSHKIMVRNVPEKESTSSPTTFGELFHEAVQKMQEDMLQAESDEPKAEPVKYLTEGEVLNAVVGGKKVSSKSMHTEYMHLVNGVLKDHHGNALRVDYLCIGDITIYQENPAPWYENIPEGSIWCICRELKDHTIETLALITKYDKTSKYPFQNTDNRYVSARPVTMEDLSRIQATLPK